MMDLHGTSCLRVDPDTSLALSNERRGPRPLALHIAQAEIAWRSGNKRKLQDFYRGLLAYRHHHYRRTSEHRPAVWKTGSCRLIDYGPEGGWPLLVIPSLINRAYILDLMPEASMLCFLSQHGIRPLLLDWDGEDLANRQPQFEDLILDGMLPALDVIHRMTDRRPLVLGYCMGGTLSVALACQKPELVAGLALLATPWDFSETNEPGGDPLPCNHLLASMTSGLGGAPVDLLQCLFAQIDPMSVPKKFARFSHLDPTSNAAVRFVAIEDWLNDGQPLSADVASACFLDWYGDNKPDRGAWRVDGRDVRPERLDLPVWLAVPDRDRIVPPQSALALARRLTTYELLRPRGGHVSMVAALKAENVLWRPLLDWLKRIVAMQKKAW